MKLQERKPLRFSLCRNASLNSMIDKDGSVLKFEGYSEKLSQLKLLTADGAAAAKNEYENFIQYEAQLHKKEFVEFNFTNEKCRVDKFLASSYKKMISINSFGRL